MEIKHLGRLMSLIESIKESEGFRSKVYKCTQGYDTIGYGFAIKDLHMDEDVAEMILKRKLDSLIERIELNMPFVKDLPKSVKDVVVEMCYQIGLTGFMKFKKTIAFLRLGKFSEASVEMCDSKWFHQTPNRARKLAKIVREAK